MRTLSVVPIVPVLGFVTAMSQQPSVAQPYSEPDAYQIYSLLLPQEESYEFATGTLIIQEETVTNAAVDGACLSPEAARRFQDAASNYEHARIKRWLLQRQFKIEKQYEVVDSKTIASVETSDQPRPKSGGTSSYPPSVLTERKRSQSSTRVASAAACVVAQGSMCWRKFRASGKKCPALHA